MKSDANEIVVVTGSKVMAAEEGLGDLKLYRVPVPVSVNAQSSKQVLFLDKEDVSGRLIYKGNCDLWSDEDEPQAFTRRIEVENIERLGLGQSLPDGAVIIYESTPYGDLMVGDDRLRDYAVGQDVEIEAGISTQVFGQCRARKAWDDDRPRKWGEMELTLTNANSAPVSVRVVLGASGEIEVRGLRDTRIKDGELITELDVPANGSRTVKWWVRPSAVD